MAVRGVDSIFHSVALKPVPSCEFLPMEAVKTNVMGTANALDAAVDANCRWSPIKRLAAEFAKEAKIKLSFTNSKSI